MGVGGLDNFVTTSLQGFLNVQVSFGLTPSLLSVFLLLLLSANKEKERVWELSMMFRSFIVFGHHEGISSLQFRPFADWIGGET